MKKFTFIIALLFYISGCAMAPKIEAVRAAVERNELEGLNQNSKFSISLPSSHSGPYDSVDQLNFNIEKGKYKGKNASAIVGQSRSTGAWEVLVVLVDESGEWIKLRKTD